MISLENLVLDSWLVEYGLHLIWRSLKSEYTGDSYAVDELVRGIILKTEHLKSKEWFLTRFMYLVSQGHNLQYVGVSGMTALEEAVEDYLKIKAENNEIHNLLKEQTVLVCLQQENFELAQEVFDRQWRNCLTSKTTRNELSKLIESRTSVDVDSYGNMVSKVQDFFETLIDSNELPVLLKLAKEESGRNGENRNKEQPTVDVDRKIMEKLLAKKGYEKRKRPWYCTKENMKTEITRLRNMDNSRGESDAEILRNRTDSANDSCERDEKRVRSERRASSAASSTPVAVSRLDDVHDRGRSRRRGANSSLTPRDFPDENVRQSDKDCNPAMAELHDSPIRSDSAENRVTRRRVRTESLEKNERQSDKDCKPAMAKLHDSPIRSDSAENRVLRRRLRTESLENNKRQSDKDCKPAMTKLHDSPIRSDSAENRVTRRRLRTESPVSTKKQSEIVGSTSSDNNTPSPKSLLARISKDSPLFKPRQSTITQQSEFNNLKNIPRRRLRKNWSEEEEEACYKAIQKHGEGNWARIRKLNYLPGRSNVDIKDKLRTMRKTGRIRILEEKFGPIEKSTRRRSEESESDS